MADARLRLRDPDGLASGLARPQWYALKGEDIAVQAAVLTHAVAEGQHFLDGNKRLAVVCLDTFLEINGYDLAVGQPELAAWILGLGLTAPAELAGRLVTPLNMDKLAGRLRDTLAKLE
ncbi:MAG TPA: type II toxin-antitoxin system death-on-curing family toxin [Chloroflexota bacterium]|nr:type II toxin-antitoxin system death-on-curing family toxin [Chloroflexota bacterium]